MTTNKHTLEGYAFLKSSPPSVGGFGRSVCGELDRDDTDSFGPENIFWKQGAPDGAYKVEVNYYAGSGAADYIVTINAPGFARQFTGTLTHVDETHLSTKEKF